MEHYHQRNAYLTSLWTYTQKEDTNLCPVASKIYILIERSGEMILTILTVVVLRKVWSSKSHLSNHSVGVPQEE